MLFWSASSPRTRFGSSIFTVVSRCRFANPIHCPCFVFRGPSKDLQYLLSVVLLQIAVSAAWHFWVESGGSPPPPLRFQADQSVRKGGRLALNVRSRSHLELGERLAEEPAHHVELLPLLLQLELPLHVLQVVLHALVERGKALLETTTGRRPNERNETRREGWGGVGGDGMNILKRSARGPSPRSRTNFGSAVSRASGASCHLAFVWARSRHQPAPQGRCNGAINRPHFRPPVGGRGYRASRRLFCFFTPLDK